MEAKLSTEKKTRFELIVELIKALAWPVFAMFIVLSFWIPLQKIMQKLPDIVERANVINIAGLSLEINQSLQLKGLNPSTNVKQVLSELTPNDISAVLALRGSASYPPESEASGRSDYDHLVSLGLYTEVSKQELDKGGKGYSYGISITPLGTETRKYLLVLISEFLQQIDTSSPTPTP